jgi:hypothetical protein
MSEISTHVYSRSGRLWAMGAKWFPVGRDQSPAQEAVRERAHYGATHAVFSDRGFALFDLSKGKSYRDIFRIYYSAAMVLRDALTTERPHLYAAFEMGDGCFYLVTVVNRRLLVTGDQLFESEDDAKAAFSSFPVRREWEAAHKVAPKRWNVPGTVEVAIGPYLDAAKPLRTQRLGRPIYLPMWTYAAAPAVALAAYWYVLPLFMPEPPKTVRAPLSGAPTAEWETLPQQIPAFAVASDRCVLANRQFLARQPAGWPLSTVTCSAMAASAVFMRTDGAPYRYAAALREGTPSADSSSITVTTAVDPSPPVSTEHMAGQTEITGALRDATGALRASVEIAVKQPGLRGDPAAAPPPPPWVRMEWTFTTTQPPALWREALTELPATTIRAITTNATTTKIEATTYARR